MKFLKLHSETSLITYKSSICSLAFCFVLILAMISVLAPIWLVSILSPYFGISLVQNHYEQPYVKFQYKYLMFISDGIDYSSILACSSFPNFNKLTQKFRKCPLIKYWTEDFDYDDRIENTNIELKFNNSFKISEKLQFNFIFFYEAELKVKCSLKPPAVLIKKFEISGNDFNYGDILLIGELNLIQNVEFFCPYYGRHIKSKFQKKILDKNITSNNMYSLENIRKLLKENTAYYKFKTTEFYYKKLLKNNNEFNIKIKLNINEVKTRYHLSIWEHLGQFWLYFASFFGVSFYICNRIKDFLFSRHILRSWEVTPWKKFI